MIMEDKDFTIDERYQELLQTILDFGKDKKDRTGTGTKSIFGYTIRWDMTQGFPLLTTKKMPMKTIATELKWFLKGDTNIKYLVDNGCNIWNGDAYKRYADIECNPPHDHSLSQKEFIDNIKNSDKFAEKWGELGPIYGKQWRDWTEYYVEKFNGGNPIIVERTKDQIANLIEELKTNPDSRRLMVSAWNVGDLSTMTLPPCHYGFQVYTRELTYDERNLLYFKKFGETVEDTDAKWELNTTDAFEDDLNKSGIPKRAISLMFNMRSVDVPLGLPFNIASYGLLLEIIAKEVNMIPDELIANLGDTHIYKNQIDGIKEQMTREPMKLPKLLFKDHLNDFDSIIDILRVNDFILDGYESHPSIKMPLSN